MSLYSSFVKHVSFPLIARRDGLGGTYGILRLLEQTQFWPQERLVNLQLQRLRSLLVHACENVLFYRKRFADAGFNPEEVNDIAALEKIPLLSKKEIRDNLDSLVASNFRPQELHSSETGGTTGVKMVFYRDNGCLASKQAALHRFERWTGWDFGEKMGLVWTAQQDYVGHWTLKSKIKNALTFRQVVFPAAVMDQGSISDYVTQTKKKKPTMIRAFVSPIYEVAKYVLNNDVQLPKLKGIITTGEPLYEHQRRTISQAFECKVFDSYRTREVGPIAQECEANQGMHINAESLFVEVVDPDEFGVGKIVVTDLLNYGMPLIRYVIGDVGKLSEKECTCGRGLPLLERVAGRIVDTLHTPDGKLITAGSLVLYLVDEAPGLLGQVQIIQDSIDHLIIKLTKSPPPSREILEYQRNTVRRLFGDEMKITFEFVDSIPLEGSGKYRFTKCLIQ